MHIHPEGGTFFITFRLAGSIPKSLLTQLKLDFEDKLLEVKKIENIELRNKSRYNLRKNYFSKVDNVMDKISYGPHYLVIPNILKIIKKELHRYDGSLYHLLCYSIMSNHVHILIDTNICKEGNVNNKDINLHRIMKNIKGTTARYINIELGRTGTLWEKESYDMYIRNVKMLNNVIAYILNNPVKAGICNYWKNYPGNYFFGE